MFSFALRVSIALSLLLPTAASAALADATPEPLVRIVSYGHDGQPIEQGTGLVLWAGSGKSVVITARHVVAQTDQALGSVEYAEAFTIGDHPASYRIDSIVANDSSSGLLVFTLPVELSAAAFADRNYAPSLTARTFVVGLPPRADSSSAVPKLLFEGVTFQPNGRDLIDFAGPRVLQGFSGGAIFDADHGILGVVTNGATDGVGGVAAGLTRVESLLSSVTARASLPPSFALTFRALAHGEGSAYSLNGIDETELALRRSLPSDLTDPSHQYRYILRGSSLEVDSDKLKSVVDLRYVTGGDCVNYVDAQTHQTRFYVVALEANGGGVMSTLYDSARTRLRAESSFSIIYNGVEAPRAQQFVAALNSAFGLHLCHR